MEQPEDLSLNERLEDVVIVQVRRAVLRATTLTVHVDRRVDVLVRAAVDTPHRLVNDEVIDEIDAME